LLMAFVQVRALQFMRQTSPRFVEEPAPVGVEP